MAEPVRVGVVGLGSFGSHHARHYAMNRAAVLTVVADADMERACSAAAKYGAVAASDHRGLIGKVDAASVTVPAALHQRIAADLIEAGIHVFVEKPLAPSVEEAGDLVARAEHAGVILQVGHIERFSPAFQALAGRIGQAERIECVRHTPWTGRSGDVDVVLDLMIHDIDLALTLAGSPVVAVEAHGQSSVTAWNDIAEATLTFASGAIAMLSTSRVASTPARTVRAGKSDTSFLADLAGPSLTITIGRGEAARIQSVPLQPGDNLGAEIAAFLASVATGSPPIVGGQAGLDAVRTAGMILAKIEQSRNSAVSRLQRSS